MPIAVGAALFMLCAWQVIASMMTSVHGAKTGARADWAAIRRALGAWAAFAVAIALVQPLGFVLSYALLTFFLMAAMYRRSFLSAFTVALATAAAFYLIFAVSLRIKFPLGPFGF